MLTKVSIILLLLIAVIAVEGQVGGQALTPTKETRDMDLATYNDLKTFLRFLNNHVRTNGRPRYGKRDVLDENFADNFGDQQLM